MPQLDPSMLGFEVDIGQIDGNLRRLWESNETASRASLLNFAIYSEEEGSLAANTSLISEFTRENACRVLLLEVRPKSEQAQARAWITAHCFLSNQDGKSVCSEQISFMVQGYSPARVSNLIFAHLDSDLPLVLFWRGSLAEHFDPEITQRVDRLLVDSATWQDPAREFTALEKAREKHPFTVYDLSWSRAFYLRANICKCFDDLDARRHLQTLEEIQISHGPGHQMSARLLVGWFAHRLGLRVLDKAKLRFANGEGKEISFVLLQAEGAEPISKLTIRTAKMRLRFTRSPEANFFVVTRVPSGGSDGQAMPADESSLGGLLRAQLGRPTNVNSYLHSMALALQLGPE